MPSGLIALFDDVAALVKASAASLDDVATQVAKTGSKVSGIVIDDAAVTPKYVVGLDPDRELDIIWAIAKKSLINKVLFLAPAALILGYFAPWIITPILMVGGCYLCFEGYEKVHSLFAPHHKDKGDDLPKITPEELEKVRTASAVRTDFILSAEIIAITYATVTSLSLGMQIAVLLSVAIGITLLVYGFVGIIVKMDDLGLHLARTGKSGVTRSFGTGLVKAMPPFLTGLSYVGTAAMLWVGAEIIAHGVPVFEQGLYAMKKALGAQPLVAFAAKLGVCITGGLVLGFVVAQVVKVAGPIISRLRGQGTAKAAPEAGPKAPSGQ